MSSAGRAWARATLCCLLAASAVHAAPPATVGSLNERALHLHEAWFEARLSMDEAQLEQEWAKLLAYLRAELEGRAQVTVNGKGANWQVELKPPGGPMSVRVDAAGARVVSAADRGEVEPTNLVSLYPWRRHYDCEGRALNPAQPGVPVAGKPCSPPPASQWQVPAAEISADDGAVVQPLKGLTACYRVVSETKGVLKPGQVLVEPTDQRYVMERLADDKLRLRYGDNRRLVVMDQKQPKAYVLER